MAKWEKVLYKDQPFPHNYTPLSFLDEVVFNAHVKERHYWRVVRGSETVVQQICTVCIALVTSFLLYQDQVDFAFMSIVCSTVLISGFLLCWMGGHILGGTLYRGIRQCTLLTSGVFFLSPLLQSLAETISTDTIIALVCILLIVHLYFHDYNFVDSVTDKLTGSVSLGCAVFSSVLIASRMQSMHNVFVQILFSMEMYLLFPFTRRYLQQRSERLYHLLTFALVAASLCFCASVSRTASILVCCSLFFVSFICPIFLVRMHKFKAKINGPWDEAVPRIPLKLKTRI